MSYMVNFQVYIWPKSVLSITQDKKCRNITSMSSTIEVISVKLRREEIERVTKREMVICWPECFKAILKTDRVKHV